MCGFSCALSPLNDEKATNIGKVAPITTALMHTPQIFKIDFTKLQALITSLLNRF
jgi:hypothetical protein